MNAMEAMSSVTGRERQLSIGAEVKDGKDIQVVVEDTGCGIDSDDLSRIFDAFFTTKRRGMGVGLAVCRSIIEAHGGKLWALPRKPFGTAFYLTIPIQRTAD
jgi:signal transduction histidine kinase